MPYKLKLTIKTSVKTKRAWQDRQDIMAGWFDYIPLVLGKISEIASNI
jgi:hypothetical protein